MDDDDDDDDDVVVVVAVLGSRSISICSLRRLRRLR